MDDISDKRPVANRLSRLPRPGSGIPKPSALPRPSSRVSGLQPPKSTRASQGTADYTTHEGDTRTSRLRASMSRDSLRSSTICTTPARANPRLRASASRDSLLGTPISTPLAVRTSQQTRAQAPLPTNQKASKVLATPRRTARASLVPEPEPEPILEAVEQAIESSEPADTDVPLFKRRLTLTRRPSEVFNVSPTEELFNSIHQDEAGRSSNERMGSEDMPPPHARTVRPRPSLTERTMQSLAQIPSSPALKKKNSSFFEPQPRSRSRAGSTSSRPGSSYNSDGSSRHTSRPLSRPGSASGHDDNGSRPGTATFKSSLTTIDGTPEGLGTSISSLRLSKTLATPSRGSLSSKIPSGRPIGSDTFSTPAKKAYGKLPSRTGPQTVASRPTPARGSTNGLFKKPSLPILASDQLESREAIADNGESEVWDSTIPSISPLRASEVSETSSSSARKSSAALRDQIAKAKAAKRAAMKQAAESQVPGRNNERSIVPVDDGFDFGVAHDDPFNLRRGENPGQKVLTQRVAAARTSGRLNIAALNLKEIPVEVMKMYDLSSIGANDGSWAESVDITRFVAADNEFETLDDFIFPDHAPGDADEDGSGNIFGGLETLDLHNNLLVNVPLGFRRLSYLTSLNLSSNRLTNNSLDTISQMPSLRDLKLANNLLFGPLPASFANLAELEILDLHGNNVSALPADVENMTHLRILNLNENSFESLPFDALAKLPITELLVRKNKLRGTLIDDPIETLAHLQTLDASSNQLLRIVELGSSISFPVMHALSLSMNRLQGLPDMTTWTSLLTLTVDENNISNIPNSFTSLEKLRHADFSSNDIRVVPPEVARMDNLSMIRLSGNPLRDKKFVSIPTDDLKEILAARLEPPPPYQEPGSRQTIGGIADDTKVISTGDLPRGGDKPPLDPQDDDSFDDDFATPPTSAPNSPSRSRAHTNTSLRSRARTLSNQMWPVKNGGLLDRAHTESSTLHPVIASKVAAEHQIKQVQLHHNLFTTFPNALSFFADTLTSLSLSHNQLMTEDYLSEELELRALRELNVSNNRITSVGPLTKNLRAPVLEKIDISFNRLTALSTNLRETFPCLTVLLVSNNHLIELIPESISGLRVVDATNNDISHLNPKIGLLGGEGGLERLDVMGNRFRVPRWNVLERGTEATLRWLRGRVPVAEMGAWKGDNGEHSPEADGGTWS